MALKAKGKVGRPRNKAKAHSKDLVAKMDAFADRLIESSEHCSVETKVAIFANAAKWVAIRNRLGEIAEDGALLDEYRGTLDAAAREAAAGTDDYRGQHPSGFRINRPSSGDNGGAELAALVSRLPEPRILGQDDDDNSGDREGSRDQGAIAIGDTRIVRTVFPGHAESDGDEPGHLDDF